MQRDKTHSLPNTIEYPLHDVIANFAMGGMAPPNEDVGCGKNACRQAMLRLLQSSRADLERAIRPQTSRNAIVHSVGVNLPNDSILALMNVFAPDRNADGPGHD